MRHVGLLPPFLGAGDADLRHPRANRNVAADKRRPAGRAALLAVVVGKRQPFAGDPVDVGRLIAHHPAVVVADVPGADVVAPDDEDVRFLGLGRNFVSRDENPEQRQSRDTQRPNAETIHGEAPDEKSQ
jgi:hypothetical protein